ncbi:hypothetical protein DFJ74DRAFT_402089 [Hyaloraphidium curvatum]|nr:hypothetical protein DFJ74DRAFT_402089 [Hyaloraphidium curvatum]
MDTDNGRRGVLVGMAPRLHQAKVRERVLSLVNSPVYRRLVFGTSVMSSLVWASRTNRKRFLEDVDLHDALIAFVMDFVAADRVTDDMAKNPKRLAYEIQAATLLLDFVVAERPQQWVERAADPARARLGLPVIYSKGYRPGAVGGFDRDSLMSTLSELMMWLTGLTRTDTHLHQLTEPIQHLATASFTLLQSAFVPVAMPEMPGIMDEYRKDVKAYGKVAPSFCDLCGQAPAEGAKLKKCSRCGIAWYCSAECQREDWKAHKPACSGKK